MDNFKDNMELCSEQKMVYNFMENTNYNLFISGKAGTGKSYLLKYFKEHTNKQVLYVAPTGVVALNIGGETIHSIFGFDNVKEGVNYFKLYSRQIDILKNLDALVIDEISMVRVDVFEQINKILKYVNRNNLPFGGKQVIVFGDIFQLPPVADKNEKAYFDNKYDGIFFFNSDAYKNGNFKYYELQIIHRQKDVDFINILNNIREGRLSENQANLLNEHCVSNLPNNIIQLVPRKELANAINIQNLNKLNSKEYTYNAIIKADKKKKKKNYRCDFVLKLKVGAHIMMIANDTEQKRWVNGTCGIITELSDNYIKVKIDGIEYTVERFNFIRYKCFYDRKTDKLVYIEDTRVSQFPLILSYAITIHKAQGMTCSEVICDVEGCFDAGQAYVALSRCANFDRLYLVHKITLNVIIVDTAVIDFYNQQLCNVA